MDNLTGQLNNLKGQLIRGSYLILALYLIKLVFSFKLYLFGPFTLTICKIIEKTMIILAVSCNIELMPLDKQYNGTLFMTFQ